MLMWSGVSVGLLGGLMADLWGVDGEKKDGSDYKINGESEGAVAHRAGKLVDQAVAECAEDD